ncbi:MAG: hypothetical protein HQL72_12470 [Magnetococcales bacterium]|nr:hypothetical protein [Magnetococcales bacterium]
MSGVDDSLKQKLLLEYEHRKDLHSDFLVMILRLLGEFIRENALGVHSFDGAVMSREGLQSTLERGRIVSSLEEMDDLVTIQVLTFFEDDVEAIANVLDTEFNILKGALDKREIQDPNRFGYHSQSYVIGMMDSRLEWIEYRRFKACRVQVRVCSLLQNTWARIQKRLAIDKATVPQHQLRATARIVGLFELADRELNKLKNTLPLEQIVHAPPKEEKLQQPRLRSEQVRALESPITNLEEVVKQTKPQATGTAKQTPPAQESALPPQERPVSAWTTETFSQIILNDKSIGHIDRAISDTFYTRLKFDAQFIDKLCEVAENFHISSQKSLLKLISKHENMIFQCAEALLEKQGTKESLIIPRGLSIMMLFYAIADDSGQKKVVEEIAGIIGQSLKNK